MSKIIKSYLINFKSSNIDSALNLLDLNVYCYSVSYRMIPEIKRYREEEWIKERLPII